MTKQWDNIPLKTICCVCQIVLKEGTGEAQEPISHGYCDGCAEKVIEEIRVDALVERIRESHPEVEDEEQYPLELGDETGG